MSTKDKNMGGSYVEDRLNSLLSLKEDYKLQTKSYEWKVKANGQEVNEPGEGDYRTQIGLVVKMQKDSDLASSLPEYGFIPKNEDGRKNRLLVKEAWDYWWRESGSDKQVSRALQSSTTYGTGILYEGIKHIYKKTMVPFFNEDNVIDFREDTSLIYSGIYTKKIPFQNFFINGTDIDNSTEAIMIDYIDKDAYLAEKRENPIYSRLDEVKDSSRFFTPAEGLDGKIKVPSENEDVVMEISYYNSAKDEYIVVANGIEILNSHIPYTHKELPFTICVDNLGEDRIWGIGEFELTEQDERTKNELRSDLINGVKASLGFWLKEKDSSFEEDDITNGIGNLYEIDDINGIQHIAQNVPIQAISEAERKIDNDIIIKTGQDINSLQTTSESATKTAGKNISSKKRINKSIKDNAYDFYKRLAYLRMKNIQFIHTMKTIEIPIKGGSIQSDGVFKKENSEDFGSAHIGADQVKGEFMVEPQVDSMTGNNKIRRKENALRYAQVVSSITGTDGKPVIKGEALAELITEEYNYDFDRMTQDTPTNQSGESILEELDAEDNGVSMKATDPNSPDFVPAEQRSGANKEVPTLSGQAKLTEADLMDDTI